ncbi:MAG: glycoside hydrolase family 47 protein [Bacteroidetes bacterium]|nr:glycoside hydrolase family 47 protein [Bacteroidota bacterium]
MKVKPLSILLIPILIAIAYQLPAQHLSEEAKKQQCDRIVEACHHAWTGYKQYANGYDALMPISRKGMNWYSSSLMMTPVDAFDTFVLMKMKKEAEEAKALIFSGLNFNRNMDVQVFEVTIRFLGGLIASYELDGDPRFLNLAKDLGKRLLPAFNSPTGMPFRYVNLVTGKTRDALNNPAEIGTCLLEFGKLTQYTGDSIYYKTAKKASFEVFKRRSRIGLVGTVIDVTTGKWVNTESQIGARIDSYYEYLYKAWLLFGDKDCKAAWDTSNVAIIKYLYVKTQKGAFFTRVDMNTGKETHPLYGALDAFYAGILTLSGNLTLAQNIQQGNTYMWVKFKIEPEEFNFRTDSITYPNYALRPENLESCFYLYRETHDEQFLRMGKRMIDDILSTCRTEAGFAAVKDVRTLELEDSMESFFFAETLKYAYLIFAPESNLDLKKIVFTTEAHPFKIAK